MLKIYLFIHGSSREERDGESYTKHLMKKNVNSLPHEDVFLRVRNETSGDLSLFIPIICIIYYRDNVLERKWSSHTECEAVKIEGKALKLWENKHLFAAVFFIVWIGLSPYF
jgi:hypothetical protein